MAKSGASSSLFGGSGVADEVQGWTFVLMILAFEPG